jgi:hypothetical protein
MSLQSFRDPVYDAVRAHIDANWNYVPIAWPNEVFAAPAGGEWVKFEIFGTVSGQQSFGMDDQVDNRWDTEGTIWFHVMVKQGRGASNARGAAQSLVDLFRGTRLLDDENLVFHDSSIGEGPVEPDGNWYRVTAMVEWEHVDA